MSDVRSIHGYALFDGMAWPHDCEAIRDRLYRARYHSITQRDMYAILSVAEAYFALIDKPRRVREYNIARIREAAAMHAKAHPEQGDR